MKMKKTIISFLLVLALACQSWGASQTFQGNITGNAATVTTNANLTGPITSTGNATAITEGNAHAAVTLNAGSEKVVNGGFATDPNVQWSVTGGGAIASVADGQAGNCLQITGQGATQYVSQTITTIANHVYKLTGYFKLGTGTNGYFRVSNASVSGSELGAIGPVTDADWTQYTINFVATNTTTYINLLMTGANGTTMLFDTVSVTEYPITANGDMYLTGNARVVIPTHANNAAAIAAGMIPGQFYRVNAATDPEPLYIVH